MPKVKQIIELLDTDRTGNDVVFNYVTPEMGEDEPARTHTASEEDLIKYIIDFELADHSDLAEIMLHNAFEDVADRYWKEIAQPTIHQNYLDAVAYMESFISKCKKPLSKADSDAMRRTMKAQFGMEFGRRAA